MFSSKYDQIWRKFRNPFSKNWYFIKCLAKIIIYFGNCFYIGFSLLQMNKSNGHLVTLSILLYPFGCPFWQTFNYNGIVVNSATPFTYLALRIGSIQATQNKCFEIEIYVTEIFDGPAFSFRSFKVVKFKIFILMREREREREREDERDREWVSGWDLAPNPFQHLFYSAEKIIFIHSFVRSRARIIWIRFLARAKLRRSLIHALSISLKPRREIDEANNTLLLNNRKPLRPLFHFFYINLCVDN